MKKEKEQLCWTCERACGGENGCEWSNFLRPVPGWTAKKIKKKDSMRYTETYHIEECPKYINDGQKRRKYVECHKRISEEDKKRIVKLREKGYTHKKIAEECDMSQYSVSKVLKQKRCEKYGSKRTVEKACGA